LALAADQQSPRVGSDRDVLVTDRGSPYEDGVTNGSRRGWGGLCLLPVLSRGRERQKQQKRPSTIASAHASESYQLRTRLTNHCG
jgi:hypothetical protein